MDNEVRKKNRVPGSCEQYTRPEEIECLQKYLKSVKAVYEDGLTLGEDNLEVTGRAAIKEVKDLSGKVNILNTRNKTTELVGGKEWIEADKDVQRLEALREKLGGATKGVELRTGKVGLQGNTEVGLGDIRHELGGERKSISPGDTLLRLKGLGDTPNLPGNVIGLENDGDTELESGVRRLSATTGTEKLESEISRIKATPLSDLESAILGLTIDEEDTKLGNSKVGLRHTGTTEDLRKTSTKLNGTSDADSLSTIKSKLGGTEEVENLKSDRVVLGEVGTRRSLEDTKVGLGGTESVDSLPTTKEGLNDTGKVELGNSKVGLRRNDDNLEKLGSTKVELGKTEESNLSDTRVRLKESDEVRSLGDEQLKLEGLGKIEDLAGVKVELGGTNGTTKLDNTKIELEGIEELRLGKTRIELDTEETTNRLGETRVGLKKKSDDHELGDTKIDLEGIKDRELENTKLDLRKPEDPKLEDTRVELEDTTSFKTLPDQLIGLSGTSEVESLMSTKENITDTRKTELGDSIVKIENTKELDKLEGSLVGLDGVNDSELGDIKVKLSDIGEVGSLEQRTEILGGRKNTDSLSNIRTGLEGVEDTNSLTDIKVELGNTDEIESLGNTAISLGGPEEIKILSETRIGLEKSDDVELGNTKVELETSEVNTLSDTRLNLSGTEDKDLGDTQIKLEGTEDKSLEDILIDLTDTRTTELEDTRISLEGPEDKSLEDTKIKLEGPEDKDLENTRLDIEDVRETGLEDTQIKLEGTEDKSLEDILIDLTDTRTTELEDTRISLEGLEDKDLENTRLDIEDVRETELEDTRLDLSGIEDKSLEDTRISLEGLEDRSLYGDETRINLTPDDKDLGDTQIKLEGPEDKSLEDTRLDIEDVRETGLEDTRLNLSGIEDKNLEDVRLDLADTRTTELDNTQIKRPGETSESELYGEETRLSKEQESPVDDIDYTGWTGALEDYLDDLVDDREDSVLGGEETRIGLEKNEVDSLGNIKITRTADTPDSNIESTNHEFGEGDDLYGDDTLEELTDFGQQFNPGTESLYNSNLIRPGENRTDNEGWDESLHDDSTLEELDGNNIDSLGNTRVELEDTENVEELESIITKRPNPLSGIATSEDLEEVIKARGREDLDTYKGKILGYADKLKGTSLDGWSSKIKSLISSYLSGDISRDRVEEFEQQLYNTLLVRDPRLLTEWNEPSTQSQLDANDYGLNSKRIDMPHYSLGGSTDVTKISNYLRWVAENTLGAVGHGKLRATLLDETLALLVLARDELERVTLANRDRLPGNDMGVLSSLVSGGAKAAASSAISSITSAVLSGERLDFSQPYNRPNSDGTQDSFTFLSSKGGAASTSIGLLNKVANSLIGQNAGNEVKFNTYISGNTGTGWTTTLKELVGEDASPSSIEELNNMLANSPYFTTAGKVTSTSRGNTKVSTLDSNTYWEVVFKPYCGSENGNRSYLPSLTEMNARNMNEHGYITAYGNWVPVNSFELGKSKLTSKTLGLFDGEISYPTSLEFTNEFRMTFVDDQFKTWRRYFELCVNSMIYYSKPHTNSNFYEGNGIVSESQYTKVNKNYVCVAPYKNACFRCIIYCMTPQLSTINKYDLLLVLKDFTEERSGEVDGGASDLTVTFSIVGENPSEKLKELPTAKSTSESMTITNSSSSAASIISSGISSALGVLT